ncbi:MAG TPA: TolC family protein, partial [Thermoanaerobaculia bacterium]|nr:TolC family protein [Thermoanaerobaculia bacterium]
SSGGAQDGPLVSEADFLAPLERGEHPAVSALTREIGEAQAAEIAARTFSAPELGLIREAPEGAARQVDVTFTWQPPRPDRRSLAIDAAAVGTRAAQARLAVSRRAVLESARAAFARWAVGALTAQVLAGRVEALEDLSTRERRRAEAGEVSGLEAQRVALAAARARSELARAETERTTASALARVWRPDLPSGAVPELPALPAPPPLPLPDAHAHPRVAALASDLERERMLERLSGKVAELPAIVAGWQRQESAVDSFDGAILGLSWPLPMVNRGRADRAAARARVASLEALLAFTELEVSAQREAALDAYTSLRTAALAGRGAPSGVPALLDAANASFTAGETDLTDLLDTLRSASETEVDALELYAEALAAHRRLESTLGDP